LNSQNRKLTEPEVVGEDSYKLVKETKRQKKLTVESFLDTAL